MEMILAKKTPPKVPEWPSYANFRKLTQKPHFMKKCKRGRKGNFSKIAQKDALPEKAQRHTGANDIILQLLCSQSAKTGENLGTNSGSKRARIAKLR